MVKLLDRVMEGRSDEDINAMTPYELLREISRELDEMFYEHTQSIEVLIGAEIRAALAAKETK